MLGGIEKIQLTGDGDEMVSPGMNMDDLCRRTEPTPGGPKPPIVPVSQTDPGSSWLILPTWTLRDSFAVQEWAPVSWLG